MVKSYLNGAIYYTTKFDFDLGAQCRDWAASAALIRS